MLARLLHFIAALGISIHFITANEVNPYQLNKISPYLNWTFKDYIQKYKPSRVWGEIEETNKENGVNKTLKDEFETIYNRIDEAEELLNLQVRNGDTKLISLKDGRRWSPSGKLDLDNRDDRYYVKKRLVELMKQAVYQVRNKMIIMQILREKYHTISLFKMGFLMSKTDTTCKTFAGFAYKSFKSCDVAMQQAIDSFPLIEMLESNERLLDLWFDVDLLADLIFINHENCKRMLNQVMANRKHAWKFVD